MRWYCNTWLWILIVFFATACGPSDGYKVIHHRFDDRHLLKDESVVIGSTIVDINVVGTYLVGLRLPIQFLTCKWNHSEIGEFLSSEIVYTNEDEEYFIVDRKSDSVYQFNRPENFKDRLVALGIAGRTKLDYSKFATTREKLATRSVEEADCSEYPEGTKSYEKSKRM